jgi:hypothetical protein
MIVMRSSREHYVLNDNIQLSSPRRSGVSWIYAINCTKVYAAHDVRAELGGNGAGHDLSSFGRLQDIT